MCNGGTHGIQYDVEAVDNRIRRYRSNLFINADFFTADWTFDILWKKLQMQANQLAGASLYFHYERYAFNAAIIIVVFWTLLSV